MRHAPIIAVLVAEGEAALSAAGIGPARMESEVLLARRMGASRAALVGEPGQSVGDDVAAAFRADVARRAARYPLQYITGIQEFHSLDFEVDERVLIPRPETEMIVDEVIRFSRAKPVPRAGGAGSARREVVRCDGGVLEVAEPAQADALAGGPLIVDVGTGSGCIAVTLAVRLHSARVIACDISEGALEIAARNASRHGVTERIRFARGDGLQPAIDAGLTGRVDFLVSNPPYVPESDLAGLQQELAHEPRGALTPGPDGLSFTAHLVAGAASLLRPQSRLLVELGAGSAARAKALLDPRVWDDVRVLPDMQGVDRVLSARLR